MKVIKFVAFLFYKYYRTGPTSRIPYFSTLCALAFIIYIHLCQLLILTNTIDYVLPQKSEENRILDYLKIAIFFVPIFLTLGLFIKKKELNNMNFGSATIRRGYINLII